MVSSLCMLILTSGNFYSTYSNINQTLCQVFFTCNRKKTGPSVKSDPLCSHASPFSLLATENSPSAKNKLAPKINLAVSSIEFCQAIFDEGDVREGLGSGSGHRAILPPVGSYAFYRYKICNDDKF